ncbi:NAC domain-containing protein [Melia azedarach]|uniref:NAC domain-containing protein n=1 Tax=Melia azedarach TaxID=155640 RepID=A0ACC1XEF0_MELAZ|nr:NAC domain-containing protein [Melia azedarach]
MFPAGVVFDPDDEELVFYYLMGKEVYGFSDEGGFRFIRVIKLYDCKPSMLSGLAAESGQDKMFFFTRLRKKYQNGRNVNRQAPGGFWKKTGPPSYVDGIYGPVATKTFTGLLQEGSHYIYSSEDSMAYEGVYASGE